MADKNRYPKKVEIDNTYETYVAVVDPADYHGDDIGEETMCPQGYRLLVDAENRIIGFVPASRALVLAKALNLASFVAENNDACPRRWCSLRSGHDGECRERRFA